MSDYAEQYVALKRKADDLRLSIARAEERQSSLLRQLDELTAKMAELGVTPETIDQKIETLESEKARLETLLTTLLEDLRERLSQVSN